MSIIYCSQALKNRWPSPTAEEWLTNYPGLFDQDDLRLAINQPANHFCEWFAAIHLFHRDNAISLVEKWNVERELAEKNERLARSEIALKEQLKDTLDKMLAGFLPICAGCKKIRDESGFWTQIDVYIQRHTNTKFTYGICPECRPKLYPELYDNAQESQKKLTKKR